MRVELQKLLNYPKDLLARVRELEVELDLIDIGLALVEVFQLLFEREEALLLGI